MKKITSKFNINKITGNRITVIYSGGKIYDLVYFDPITLTEGLDLIIEYDVEKQQYLLKLKYALIYTIECYISSLIFDQEIRNEIKYLIKKINRQLSNPMLYINRKSLKLKKFKNKFEKISEINMKFSQTSLKETNEIIINNDNISTI